MDASTCAKNQQRKNSNAGLSQLRPADSRECIVVGNGPSSRLINYEYLKKESIPFLGMNSAYRHWRKTGAYPEYYISIDTVVTSSNAGDIKNLIDESPIKLFLLADEFIDAFPGYENHPNVLTLSNVIANASYQLISKDCTKTTGAWALRLAAELGFSIIRTIGFDGIRDEILANAQPSKQDGELGLVITSTPTFNPNYFFSGYQVKGDKYQVPNADGFTKSRGIKLHTLAIKEAIGDIAESAPQTEVYSCSIDDYTSILEKSPAIGIVHQNYSTISAYKPQSNLQESIRLIISDLMHCYHHALPLEANLLDADDFYFGRPSALVTKEQTIDYSAIKHATNTCYFPERPILYIKEIAQDEASKASADFSIYNYIKQGGVIELEPNTGKNLNEFIESLNISDYTKKNLLNYPLCLFVNQFSKKADGAFALKLSLKDFLTYLTSKKRQSTSFRKAKSSQSININSPSPGTPSENFNWRKDHDQNINYILIYHGIISASNVNICLEIVSEEELSIEFNLVPNRTTPSTREKTSCPLLITIKPGINYLRFRRSYEHYHTVTRGTFRAKESSNSGDSLIIKSISFVAVDKKGLVYLKNWSLPPEKTKDSFKQIVTANQESNGFIFLEPDMKDKQGHYFRYTKNLLTHDRLASFNKYLLARSDLEMDETISKSRVNTIKCFQKNSWTIQTNREQFAEELYTGLQSIPINSYTYIYMYTGSVFHAIELIKLIKKHPKKSLIFTTCNLFWEMIKDTDSDQYLNAYKEIKNLIGDAYTKIQLTAPSASVQSLIADRCNIEINTSPHPSTALSDHQFYQFIDNPAINEPNNPKTIFFPGVDTIHKGYDYGIKICKELLQKGYQVKIRPSPSKPLEIYNDNLEIVELGIAEEVFNRILFDADLIVLPYMPEGFRSRTSGLIVDSLFSKTFAAVIEETWLASFVNRYRSGITLPSNSAQRSAMLIDNFLQSTKTSRPFSKSIIQYFNENSWEKLIDQILTNS